MYKLNLLNNLLFIATFLMIFSGCTSYMKTSRVDYPVMLGPVVYAGFVNKNQENDPKKNPVDDAGEILNMEAKSFLFQYVSIFFYRLKTPSFLEIESLKLSEKDSTKCPAVIDRIDFDTNFFTILLYSYFKNNLILKGNRGGARCEA